MLYTNLSIDRKNLYQLDFLNIYYECDTSLEVLQVPLQAFIFSEFLFFFFFLLPKLFIVWKRLFSGFPLDRRDINGMSLNPLTRR